MGQSELFFFFFEKLKKKVNRFFKGWSGYGKHFFFHFFFYAVSFAPTSTGPKNSKFMALTLDQPDYIIPESDAKQFII